MKEDLATNARASQFWLAPRKMDGSNVLDCFSFFFFCLMCRRTPPSLSCIRNDCSLLDGRQLLEIVFSFVVHAGSAQCPSFILRKQCPVFLFDRGMKRAWFDLANTEIDRWFMGKYSQWLAVGWNWVVVAGHNLVMFWKNNYCLLMLGFNTARRGFLLICNLSSLTCHEEYIWKKKKVLAAVRKY